LNFEYGRMMEKQDAKVVVGKVAEVERKVRVWGERR
jgi:hypothetical protein